MMKDEDWLFWPLIIIMFIAAIVAVINMILTNPFPINGLYSVIIPLIIVIILVFLLIVIADYIGKWGLFFKR
jgi:hypothetical protein